MSKQIITSLKEEAAGGRLPLETRCIFLSMVFDSWYNVDWTHWKVDLIDSWNVQHVSFISALYGHIWKAMCVNISVPGILLNPVSSSPPLPSLLDLPICPATGWLGLWPRDESVALLRVVPRQCLKWVVSVWKNQTMWNNSGAIRLF